MATSHDLALQLLNRAAEDEAAVRAVLDVPDVSDAIAGFHAQQAVEKALKAVMAERAVDFPFSHDLSVLLGFCEQASIEVPSELADVDRLTPYAARLRYGGEISGGVDRATGLRWATTAVAWARSIVEPLSG